MARVIVLDDLSAEGLAMLDKAPGMTYEVRTGLKGDALRESLAQFDGSVLKALSEVETALSAYQNGLKRQQRLAAAREQAATASRIVAAQQREGQVDALVLLDAQRSFADAESQLAVANAEIAQEQVQLFKVLGGGWTPTAG